MSDVLFIKTSSLGDVIHHMPALTEARARRPADRFAWVVEEAFAPLLRLHPAVDEVIPVAARRWRGFSLLAPSTWLEIVDFRRRLRSREYAEVIDTQGLFFKSAMIARGARGRRHGYDARSIKETTAASLYDVRHRVEKNQHAIARNRMLTGLALGYAPQGEPDYGLDAARLAATAPAVRYGVLFHATAKPGKEWPVEHWRSLVTELARDFDVVLPWGTEAEQARAHRIASGIARARIPDRRPLDDMARLIAGASFVVGVDTGLMHLAAALGVPLVAIFVDSEPGLTGPVGRGAIKVLGAKGSPPRVADVTGAVRQIIS
jgi:lipopolysaccharide heptosyltransferase I